MENVVYVNGGVAYEASGETLIIDFDELGALGASEAQMDLIEKLVEEGNISQARAVYEHALSSLDAHYERLNKRDRETYGKAPHDINF